MSGKQRNRGWASAVLCLGATLVMAGGQVVPWLHQVPAVVWATATLLLVAALVVALRRGRAR